MSYTEMAQLELLNAAANVTSQEDLDALRLTLSLFFAERAQKAIFSDFTEQKRNTKTERQLKNNQLDLSVVGMRRLERPTPTSRT